MGFFFYPPPPPFPCRAVGRRDPRPGRLNQPFHSLLAAAAANGHTHGRAAAATTGAGGRRTPPGPRDPHRPPAPGASRLPAARDGSRKRWLPAAPAAGQPQPPPCKKPPLSPKVPPAARQPRRRDGAAGSGRPFPRGKPRQTPFSPPSLLTFPHPSSPCRPRPCPLSPAGPAAPGRAAPQHGGHRHLRAGCDLGGSPPRQRDGAEGRHPGRARPGQRGCCRCPQPLLPAPGERRRWLTRWEACWPRGVRGSPWPGLPRRFLRDGAGPDAVPQRRRSVAGGNREGGKRGEE